MTLQSKIIWQVLSSISNGKELPIDRICFERFAVFNAFVTLINGTAWELSVKVTYCLYVSSRIITHVSLK